MPRNLPWVMNPKDRPSSSRSPRTPKKPHSSDGLTPEPTLPAVPLSLKVQKTATRPESTSSYIQRTPVRHASRTPSSSPPPAPPEDVFMEDGLDKDDRYRMVEDEFLDIAKDFTRHLHHQEYQRYKNAAKEKNAAAISSITRPVSGIISDRVKRRTDAAFKTQKRKKAVEAVAPKDDSDDDIELLSEKNTMGSGLHGLMGTRKSTESLAKLGNVISSTRASAGYKRRRTETIKAQRSTQDSSSRMESRHASAASLAERQSSVKNEDIGFGTAMKSSQARSISQQANFAQDHPQPLLNGLQPSSKPPVAPEGGPSHSKYMAVSRTVRKPRIKKEQDDNQFSVMPTFFR